MWGLIQSTCVNVPANRELFLHVEKRPKASGAPAEILQAKSTVQKIKIKEILYLKEVLLPTLEGVYHLVLWYLTKKYAARLAVNR